MGHYASEMGFDEPERHYESSAEREKRLLENRVKALEGKVDQLSHELDTARRALEVSQNSLQEQISQLTATYCEHRRLTGAGY